jgi:hypothetical protein
MREDNLATTPQLAETIRVLIDSVMVETHVCMPAKIVNYDPQTQYADVEIQLLRKYENGNVIKLPIIQNVPVKHPRANGGAAFVHMPLKPGDDMTLIVCERSLDNWKNQGGLTDPADRRKFNLTDAFALIGGSAIPDAFQVSDPDAIEIVNSTSTKLKIKSDGKYIIHGGNGDELITVLSDFIEGVGRAFTTTALGPEKLIDPEDPGFALVKARLDAFKG